MHLRGEVGEKAPLLCYVTGGVVKGGGASGKCMMQTGAIGAGGTANAQLKA